MGFRRTFGFNRGDWIIFIFLAAGWLMLGSGAAGAATEGLAGASGGVSPVPVGETDVETGDEAVGLPPTEFRLSHTLSLGIGTFQGDGSAFAKYEDRALPSLNPDIVWQGRVQLRTWLTPDLHVRLQTPFAGEGQTTFGVGWRGWDAEYGHHAFQFAATGLAYTKFSEGLRLRYAPADSAPAVQAVVARTNARDGEATLRGDDTFGPFFLGQRRIVPESEQVVVDGRMWNRGGGPGEGDYFIDYDGGFIYFHHVLLRHQTAVVTFQYYIDDPGLASDFTAVLGRAEGVGVTWHGFALRDDTPLDKDAIVAQPGTTLWAYGVRSEWTAPSGWRGVNTVLATDVRARRAVVREETDRLAVRFGQTDYKLSRRPVLYESERVFFVLPSGDTNPLIRHLDYSLNYHAGELHLNFEPEADTSLIVHYRHVDDVSPTEDPPLQGVHFMNRFDYAGSPWQTAGWLDVVDGDYVQVGNRREPPVLLSAGMDARYGRGGWGVVGRWAITGQRGSTGATAGVGMAYAADRWTTELLVGRDVHVAQTWSEIDSHVPVTRADYVQGAATWRGAGLQVGMDFKQSLDTYAGGLPEQLTVGAAGRVGPWPISAKYVHGGRHYAEEVDARITFPVAGANGRGSLSVGGQWLFKEGFGHGPRTVYSMVGDAAYIHPTGAYVRSYGVLSTSALGPVETRAYTLRADAGRSLGLHGLIDYQLRLSGRRTGVVDGPTGPWRAADEHRTFSHTVTLAGQLWPRGVPGLSGTLMWRGSDGFRWRPDGGANRTVEQGWHGALHLDVSPASPRWPAMQFTLSYDISRSDGPVPNPQRTAVEKIRLAVMAERDAVSLTASAEHALFDGWRLRRTVAVSPSIAVSEHARVWLAYEYTAGASIDPQRPHASEPKDEASRGQRHPSAVQGEDWGYDVHDVRIGLTIEF